MKWLAIVVLAVAALVLIVIGVGALLPRHHVARVTATYHQPPDTIWQTLTDVAAYPSWRHELQRVELLPDRDGHRRWREVGAFGPMTLEADEADAPRRFVTRIADTTGGFGGRWTFEIDPAISGSTVIITEDGEVYTPIFRFVSRFLIGQYRTLEGYARALGERFGETPEIRRI